MNHDKLSHLLKKIFISTIWVDVNYHLLNRDILSHVESVNTKYHSLNQSANDHLLHCDESSLYGYYKYLLIVMPIDGYKSYTSGVLAQHHLLLKQVN